MSDQNGQGRPRPQYGEYATPEEQRAAIKQPAEWQLEGLEETDAAPQPVAPGSYRPGGSPQPPAQPPQPVQPPQPAQPAFHWPQEESRPPQPATRVGFGDRLITFVLLGFGLSNVLSTISNAMGGGGLMRQSMAELMPDSQQLANSLPSWLWMAEAIAYSAVWLVTLFTSIAAMRKGRRSFWIPLVGGVVAGLLSLALLVIAIGQNPQLLDILPTPGATGTPT